MLPPEAADEPYCYLTTRGRRSGQPRTVELWFAALDDALFALAGGRETAAWVRNLQADPDVRLRVAGRSYVARARAVEGEPEEQQVREALAAKYQGWSPGRPLSRWARTALPVRFDLRAKDGAES